MKRKALNIKTWPTISNRGIKQRIREWKLMGTRQELKDQPLLLSLLLRSPTLILLLAAARTFSISCPGMKERCKRWVPTIGKWAPIEREKERCSGSYCQAVVFLVIKHDSISERPGYWQWGSRYTAHAGRNLPVKEFCYLRTNDTTAAMWSQVNQILSLLL